MYNTVHFALISWSSYLSQFQFFTINLTFYPSVPNSNILYEIFLINKLTPEVFSPCEN